MLSPIGVVLIGCGFVFACLITIYLYAAQINKRSTSNIGNLNYEPAHAEEQNNTTKESSKSKNKTKSKKDKKPSKNNFNAESTHVDTVLPASSPSSSEVSITYDEEDDIIALASLKGFDVTGIRRRNLPQSSESKVIESIKSSEISVVDKKPNPKVKSTNTVINAAEEIKVEQEVVAMIIENAHVFEDNSSFENSKLEDSIFIHELGTMSQPQEWSSMPTRDEEITKNLKNKIANLQTELEESEYKCGRTSSQLEQAQKRISLLERELHEQNKATNSMKLSNESQMAALRAVNREIMSKLALVEADTMNTSVLKGEAERAKDTILQLQNEIRQFEEEKFEIIRQLSEFKNENAVLRENMYVAEKLSEKCTKLEEELEEARREMSLQVETAQAELQHTRAKLESEIAFHRAEHANSVGSSTALHQEISQLKSDLEKITEADSQNQIRIRELEELNSQLLNSNDEQKSLKSELDLVKQDLKNAEVELNNLKDSLLQSGDELKAKINENLNLENMIKVINSELKSAEENTMARNDEILALKAELSSKNSELSSLNEECSTKSSEIDSLREKLSEAELKITGLQSDLTREIKRADISKKVYETKLAELEKMKN